MGDRQGYDLLTKMGRSNFFMDGLFGDRWSRGYAMGDTFGHHICAVIGHSKRTFLARSGNGPKHAYCYRCSRRVQSSTQSTIEEVEE